MRKTALDPPVLGDRCLSDHHFECILGFLVVEMVDTPPIKIFEGHISFQGKTTFSVATLRI
jgi:hypothetical protein